MRAFLRRLWRRITGRPARVRTIGGRTGTVTFLTTTPANPDAPTVAELNQGVTLSCEWRE